MQIVISILLLALVSFAAFSEQGTLSTDDTTASQAEASLSGTTDEEMEAQEEDVRIEDDEFDPNVEIDEERMDEYQEEVQY